ncbi:hypothetical protein DLJ53_13795 [Acuticoccus sediminis]|uniref:TRAP-type C4-dicarboxylate transport system substrate-binding protein n=1 Tax=Acuticoccus sediminis TaxID=2184697 RepID=A0A8B2NX91_9HYPH|nr:TRAP transporter substrate-binding protein DctP [Acuticoccus sediminis]RAI02423.1 hypothetical protein DLJ53_13795 [Acuticoccus sediminis]
MRTWIHLATAAALWASAGTAGAADFNWRFVGVNPASHEYSKLLIESFKRIEERTGGALSIEFVTYGETPYKAVDALTLVRDGLIEMTEWVPAYNASTYPLLAGPQLPFLMKELLSVEDFQKATDAAWQTETIASYKDGILGDHGAVSLATGYYDPINLWFTGTVTDMDGIVGKKVRAFSPEQAEFLSAAGASPVNISAADAYTGLQRGVIDGVFTGAAAVVAFKWNEVLKSGFATNVLLLSLDEIVSEARLNELPEDVRAVLLEEMDSVEAEIRATMPKISAAKLDQLKADGFTITTPTPELYAKFHEIAVEHVYPQWAERGGEQAKEVLADLGIELK